MHLTTSNPTARLQEEHGRYDIQHLPSKIRTAHMMEAVYPRLQSEHHADEARFIPWLNLRGYWLNAAGFYPGQRIRIEVYDGKLVITPG